MTRDDIIQGLRDLTDWLEQTPAAQLDQYNTISFYGMSKDQMVALAKTGGGMSKEYVGPYFSMVKDFAGIRYECSASREEVCTKRVVGTQKVMKVDPAAPKVEVEEEVVEWDCHPLLSQVTKE